MKRRTRTIGALLALFAFTAYVAENVWASTCMPGTAGEMMMIVHGASQHGVAHQPGGTSPGADAAVGAPSADDTALGSAVALADERALDPLAPPPCPLAAAGVGGSCVALSLPGSSSSFDPRDTISSGVSLTPPGPGEILLVTAIFRPPRA